MDSNVMVLRDPLLLSASLSEGSDHAACALARAAALHAASKLDTGEALEGVVHSLFEHDASVVK